MRPSAAPTWILALCIAALAVYNLALEVQVRLVQQQAAMVEQLDEPVETTLDVEEDAPVRPEAVPSV